VPISLLNPTPQQRAALWALVCVLLAHAALLGLWPTAPGPGWQAVPAAARALQVRQIFSARPADIVMTKSESPAMTGGAVAATAPPALAPKRASPRPLAGAPSITAPSTGPPLPPDTPPRPDAAAAPPSALLPSSNNAATPEPGGDSVPTFATSLPAPFEARYAVQRGLASGRAELRWQRQNDRYELSLRTSAFGAPALSWASVGAVDEHGLAPERHTESRRNKELRAVNFQRDSGRISFSGPQLQYPLTAGAQDRLTWMLQLPAILQANPALAVAGAQVPLFVVGARGDAEVWAFQVLGVETLDLPDGSSVNALHLKREPRRPYDTQTEVWLDPARQHLLVRALMRVRATGEGTEFLLDGYTGAKAP
jgi:Protein of unknown function (DUF3108)